MPEADPPRAEIEQLQSTLKALNPTYPPKILAGIQ